MQWLIVSSGPFNYINRYFGFNDITGGCRKVDEEVKSSELYCHSAICRDIQRTVAPRRTTMVQIKSKDINSFT